MHQKRNLTRKSTLSSTLTIIIRRCTARRATSIPMVYERGKIFLSKEGFKKMVKRRRGLKNTKILKDGTHAANIRSVGGKMMRRYKRTSKFWLDRREKPRRAGKTMYGRLKVGLKIMIIEGSKKLGK